MLLFPHVLCRSTFYQSRFQGISANLFVRLQFHPVWPLAFVCLSRVYHSVCALSGLMRDPVSWHHWDTLSSCCIASAASWEFSDDLYMSHLLPEWESWFRSATDRDSGDPCGRPIVSRWRAELQFPSCITTVLFRSAPAIHRVSVRLSPYCMSRSISSLNWTLCTDSCT